jgi:hypothetical protein
MSHDKVEAQAEASYADNVLSTTPPDKEISGLLTPPPTTEQRLNDSEAGASCLSFSFRLPWRLSWYLSWEIAIHR